MLGLLLPHTFALYPKRCASLHHERPLSTSLQESNMNNLSDYEAVDTFRQVIARIVRRLLEENKQEEETG